VFASGTLVGAVMFAMLLSLTFLLPCSCRSSRVHGVQAGLALMPRSLVMMVMMPSSGASITVSPRLDVAFGVVLFTLSA
jgi:DHA2 family multidrug resistance protein